MIKEKGERGKQKTSKCQINTIKCQNILAKRSGLEEELKGNKEIKNRPNIQCGSDKSRKGNKERTHLDNG